MSLVKHGFFLGMFVITAVIASQADACIGGPPGARCAPAPGQPMDPYVKAALQIMEVLNVEEVDRTPGAVGARNTQKSVGGLVCKKSVSVGPRRAPRASCEFKSRPNYKAVYEALNVRAINITPAGFAGSVQNQKKVGNLVCLESRPVVPRAKSKYACELQ